MSGKVVHFEIPFDDGERAGRFYADVFGWHVVSMPDMGYTLVSTGPTDPQTGQAQEAGFINGGMFRRTGDFAHPNVVINVDSIDEALAGVEKAGGSTVRGREPVGDVGFAAYFTDTEGNLLCLWEVATPS